MILALNVQPKHTTITYIKYIDNTACLPLKETELLLGKPWEYGDHRLVNSEEGKVMYNGAEYHTITLSFERTRRPR